MHIILALAGLAVTAYIWMNRAQRGAHIAGELMDAAADVKNAARRFGFRRRANQHPVEGIEDPKLAIGALAMAFLEMDDLPTADARAGTDIALRKHLRVDATTAQEIAVLGRWFVSECGSPDAAFPRLAKRLKRLDNGASFQTLMDVLADVSKATGSANTPHQTEALGDLARIFRTA